MKKWGASHLPFLTGIAFLSCVLDPCQPNPCEHGGDCLVHGRTFTCSCLAPFSGNKCQKGGCIITRSTLSSELNKKWSFLCEKSLCDAMERIITANTVSCIVDSSAGSQAASHWILTPAL